MLLELRVSNYALINHLVFMPSQGLNVITGETGSGKSILLGALGLVLGERADTSALKNHSDKCVVEASFDISGYQLNRFFDENDLDYQQTSIVRREINTGGKSRAFINDTPVLLSVLKAFGEHLVDIHSQHESIALFEQQSQRQLLDEFSLSNNLISSYKQAFLILKETTAQLAVLKEKQQLADKEADFKKFLFDELNEANPLPDEMEQLEKEAEWLQHIQDSIIALQEANFLLSESEQPVLANLRYILGRLQKISGNANIEECVKRLQSATLELDDISNTLLSELNNTAENPERLEEVNQRLALLQSLLKKHKVSSVAELIMIKKNLESELLEVFNMDDEIEKLTLKVEESENNCLKLAGEMHNERLKGKSYIEKRVNHQLQLLDMPYASMQFEIIKRTELTEHGLDESCILFSANKGMPHQLLHKVASGGELSRLMLVLKAMLAEKKALPTLIFDEADSGISGQAALLTSRLIKRLSNGMQVICITHLPQMAASGNTHFEVYKNHDNTPVETLIRKIEEIERPAVIARMISGSQAGDEAIANARQMLLAALNEG